MWDAEESAEVGVRLEEVYWGVTWVGRREVNDEFERGCMRRGLDGAGVVLLWSDIKGLRILNQYQVVHDH